MKKSTYLCTVIQKISYQLKLEIMSTYKITLECKTVLSVNGKRVKSDVTTTTQTVIGLFADVAKVMYQHEVNCIKHNTLPKLTKDVYTYYQSKNSVEHILVYGCSVTQICNKLGKNASSFLQLIQTSELVE